MRLKVFQAKTMADAMAEIRQSLGEDAIIIDNEITADSVRITAAMDSSEQAPIASHPDTPDVADTLYDLLAHHRIPLPITEKLIGMALMLDTQDPVLALGSAFDTAFSFHPLHPTDSAQRILLIGPPGQGKTVTTARLAARAILTKRPVQVITADSGRAGAVAQINELCRPMNLIPQILTPAVLSEANEGLAIIDGPGMNPFNITDRTEIEKLINVTGAEPILVISAGAEAEEAAQIGEIFFALGVQRFIATQIDTTRRLGNILTIAAAGLACADAGIGRTLIDTLVPMNPLALARLLAAARVGTHSFDASNCEEAA